MPGLKDLVSGGLDGILKGAEGIIARFKADPTKVIEVEAELEKLRINAEIEKAKIEVAFEAEMSKQLETVNATMREEGKSEHWMVWSWRPLIGFTFCAMLINNYILLPYFKNRGMEVIIIPPEVWSAILVILGVASAGRSVTSWQKAKNA